MCFAGVQARVNTMGAGFNKQILAQKLAKLNSSQQSIESILLDSFSAAINLVLSFLHVLHCNCDQPVVFP
jgi:hypothetical protein